MRTYENCFIAGEAIEWIRRWLRDMHQEFSPEAANYAFHAMLDANLFEIVDTDHGQVCHHA